MDDLTEVVVTLVADAVEAEQGHGKQIPARKAAERLFNAHPDLMMVAQRVFAIDRLTWLIERERTKMRVEALYSRNPIHTDPAFRDLPRTIFLRDHSRPTLDYCSLKEVEEHLALLSSARRKNPPRIALMVVVAAILRRWSERRPGIRWLEAIELETKSIVESCNE